MLNASPRLHVLESFPAPGSYSNPYVVQLAERLGAREDVTLDTFSWRAALVGRVDVFHAHWPEAIIEWRRSALSTFARRVLYLILLLKLRVTRAPIVRTMHNLELPRGMGGFATWLLRLTDRWTTLAITINPVTEDGAGRPSAQILHGHYRDWFASYDVPATVPGRVLFFGRIRRYKNVEGLIRAFRAIPADAGVTLHVCGKPSSADLEAQVRAEAGDDQRITIDAGFVDDGQLVHEIGAAQLIVLPYPEMHNSGSVLLALSLGRPVLVPDLKVNRALRAEVGEQWMQLFSMPLDARAITDALAAVSAPVGAPAGDALPDLSARGWDAAADAHVAAFHRAVALRRRR